MKKLILLVALFPLWAHSGSIYLCKAYSGATFWAGEHCNRHNALIDSIVSVPDNLSFEQQVKMAEQQRPSTIPAHVGKSAVGANAAASNKLAECKSLDAQISEFDALARRPQSGKAQDWITGAKRKARDRQSALRC